MIFNIDAFWVPLMQQPGRKIHWRKYFYLGEVHQHFLHVFQRPDVDLFLNLPHINTLHVAMICTYNLHQVFHYPTFHHILHGNMGSYMGLYF